MRRPGEEDAEGEPEPELSYSQRAIRYMSATSDQHKYVTGLINDHPELYNRPHTLQMYADSYKVVNNKAKMFCSDIASLKWQLKQTSAEGQKAQYD